MILRSNRLEIIPLNLEEVEQLLNDITKFEEKMGLIYKGQAIKGHLLDVTKIKIDMINKDRENYLWNTFWIIVLKEEKCIIGSAGFKGVPDNEGTVEIGYGLNEIYFNMGYMTQALSLMCNWALNKQSVKNIIAETEKWNIGSLRVLEKNDFKIYRETEKCFWWEKRGD